MTDTTKTEIIALGTGAAFTMNNWQTNYIISITKDDKAQRLLVDCGTDIRFSLRDQGFSYLDIDALFVSHAHGDHAAGIDYIAFPTYFDGRYQARRLPTPDWKGPKIKPILFAERQLMKDLWAHSWQGSLEGLEGVDATLDTYFDTRPIKVNDSFVFGGVKFDIVQSIHVSAKYALVNSFGLMFTDRGKRIYMTSDCQYAPETSMKAYYSEADIIVHDCETIHKPGVHAHYDDLRTLKPEVKAKMRLVHYQDNVLDNWDEWQQKAHDDGFYGFVKPGVIYVTAQ